MLKELITKTLTIAFVLGALHATAGGINPEKMESKDGEKVAVVESDSTKKASESTTTTLETLSEKVTKQSSNGGDSDNEVSSTESSTSIVTFNFVYYLLEKFKFSDLLGR